MAHSAPVPARLVTAPPPPSLAVPPAPRVTLLGVATDVVNGTDVRRAILSADGVVTIAREGDEVAGQFRVGKVNQEVVDLERTTSGERLTLTLGH